MKIAAKKPMGMAWIAYVVCTCEMFALANL